MAMGGFATWVPMLNRLLVAILIAIYILFQIYFRPKLIPEIWLFAAFVVWAGFSGMIVAQDEKAFVQMFTRVARACGLAIAIAGICQMKRSVTVNFVAVLVVALAWAAYSWESGVYEMGYEVSSKNVAIPWNTNSFGVVMLAGIFALAHLWGLKKALLYRTVMLILAIFLASSLVSSASRKSFFALLVFGSLWVWLCYKKKIFRNIVVLILVINGLVGIYYFTNNILENTRLGVRLSHTGEDSGDKKRFAMYEALPVLLKINPVAGVGLGNFGVHAHMKTGSYAYSHSDYVEVATTTGIVGVSLYFSIYIMWWRRLRRLARASYNPEVQYQAKLFQAILLTMLLLGFGVPNFMQTEQWYWVAAMIGYTYAWDLQISEQRRYGNIAQSEKTVWVQSPFPRRRCLLPTSAYQK
jgi:O-antigen ligase